MFSLFHLLPSLIVLFSILDEKGAGAVTERIFYLLSAILNMAVGTEIYVRVIYTKNAGKSPLVPV